MIVAICAAIPLLIAGGALLVSVTQGRRATEVTVALGQARDVSASGAQDALAQLAVDPNYLGEYDLALGGPVAHVVVSSWDGDGLDNDGDGVVDGPGEADLVGVVSSGTTNVTFDAFGLEIARATRHARSVTEAVVQKTDLDIAVDQAVYIDDPLAQFKFAGTQFLVSGDDVNLDGTAGPNASIPGIGTPGDPADIISQLNANQEPLVQGLGGPPSVQTTPDLDLTAQIAQVAALASMVWNGPDDTYNGAIGDRTNLVPVIAYAKGNLKINGDTTGCGILIVDGDLDIDGGFDFAGFIYASGAVTFNGGGGDKELHGALFTLGAVNGPDVTFNGSVQIQYSSEALAAVTSQLAGSVTLVSWLQR